MIKLISLKTRRAHLSRGAFRSYYEERHVPLGLRYIAQFRWRKYVRNHLSGEAACLAGFDCFTEFWVASAADQAITRAFLASPEFAELDDDDRYFLDVERRCAFEVVERLLAGRPREPDPAPTRRRTLLLQRLSTVAPSHFLATLDSFALRLVREVGAEARRVTLDLPVDTGDTPRPVDALLSVWPPAHATATALPAFPREVALSSEFALDVIETPPHELRTA